MPLQRVGEVELHYEISGEGESVLFLHGLGAGTDSWLLQVEYFSRHYRVITCDARGHGQSSKPPGPYSVPLFAADVAGLLRALDVAPVHVVGVSMGGMMGLQLAVDAPELVRSLVVVNSAADLVPRTWQQRFRVLQRFFVLRVLGVKALGKMLSRQLFPKEEQGTLRALFAERWAENDPRAYWEATKGLVGWSVSDRLESITCPVLVVAADHDYTPVETKAALVRRLPRGELVVIEDSRHATPVEQPQQFNRAVHAFLAKQN